MRGSDFIAERGRFSVVLSMICYIDSDINRGQVKLVMLGVFNLHLASVD